MLLTDGDEHLPLALRDEPLAPAAGSTSVPLDDGSLFRSALQRFLPQQAPAADKLQRSSEKKAAAHMGSYARARPPPVQPPAPPPQQPTPPVARLRAPQEQQLAPQQSTSSAATAASGVKLPQGTSAREAAWAAYSSGVKGLKGALTVLPSSAAADTTASATAASEDQQLQQSSGQCRVSRQPAALRLSRSASSLQEPSSKEDASAGVGAPSSSSGGGVPPLLVSSHSSVGLSVSGPASDGMSGHSTNPTPSLNGAAVASASRRRRAFEHASAEQRRLVELRAAKQSSSRALKGLQEQSASRHHQLEQLVEQHQLGLRVLSTELSTMEDESSAALFETQLRLAQANSQVDGSLELQDELCKMQLQAARERVDEARAEAQHATEESKLIEARLGAELSALRSERRKLLEAAAIRNEGLASESATDGVSGAASNWLLASTHGPRPPDPLDQKIEEALASAQSRLDGLRGVIQPPAGAPTEASPSVYGSVYGSASSPDSLAARLEAAGLDRFGVRIYGKSGGSESIRSPPTAPTDDSAVGVEAGGEGGIGTATAEDGSHALPLANGGGGMAAAGLGVLSPMSPARAQTAELALRMLQHRGALLARTLTCLDRHSMMLQFLRWAAAARSMRVDASWRAHMREVSHRHSAELGIARAEARSEAADDADRAHADAEVEARSLQAQCERLRAENASALAQAEARLETLRAEAAAELAAAQAQWERQSFEEAEQHAAELAAELAKASMSFDERQAAAAAQWEAELRAELKRQAEEAEELSAVRERKLRDEMRIEISQIVARAEGGAKDEQAAAVTAAVTAAQGEFLERQNQLLRAADVEAGATVRALVNELRGAEERVGLLESAAADARRDADESSAILSALAAQAGASRKRPLSAEGEGEEEGEEGPTASNGSSRPSSEGGAWGAAGSGVAKGRAESKLPPSAERPSGHRGSLPPPGTVSAAAALFESPTLGEFAPVVRADAVMASPDGETAAGESGRKAKPASDLAAALAAGEDEMRKAVAADLEASLEAKRKAELEAKELMSNLAVARRAEIDARSAAEAALSEAAEARAEAAEARAKAEEAEVAREQAEEKAAKLEEDSRTRLEEAAKLEEDSRTRLEEAAKLDEAKSFALRAQVASAEERASAADERIDELVRRLSHADQTASALQAEVEGAAADAEAARGERHEALEALQAQASAAEAHAEAAEAAQLEAAELTAELEAAKAALEAAKAELDALTQQHESLRADAAAASAAAANKDEGKEEEVNRQLRAARREAEEARVETNRAVESAERAAQLTAQLQAQLQAQLEAHNAETAELAARHEAAVEAAVRTSVAEAVAAAVAEAEAATKADRDASLEAQAEAKAMAAVAASAEARIQAAEAQAKVAEGKLGSAEADAKAAAEKAQEADARAAAAEDRARAAEDAAREATKAAEKAKAERLPETSDEKTAALIAAQAELANLRNTQMNLLKNLQAKDKETKEVNAQLHELILKQKRDKEASPSPSFFGTPFSGKTQRKMPP